MESRSHFLRLLRGLDGKSYTGYKSLCGSYDLGFYKLFLDHVQGDPYAPPSRARVQVHADLLRLKSIWIDQHEQRVAVEDFLTRRLVTSLEMLGKKHRGSGRSGVILIDTPGQTVLRRSSVRISCDEIEVRLSIGLPADGRRIRAKDAEAMFLDDLPFIIDQAFSRTNLSMEELEEHVSLYGDQCFVRRSLVDKCLVAFIGDGSILARRSGISELPMDDKVAEKFVSPDSMRITWQLPSGKSLSGMGIKEGVTIIVGGGFHGKSTLLQAIAGGVFNHIKGDGREFCITDESAVKIRAEDGRRVSRVDISGFISNLPRGRSTSVFSTQDASGSTSQAAAIVEAMELGAKVFLIDEDTSATNFMIRDARMQKLVVKAKEPITPFIDRVRELYRGFGVSSILVIGGSGDYLDVANTVIMLDEYKLFDVTKEARQISEQMPVKRKAESAGPLAVMRSRFPQPMPDGVKMERLEAKSRFVLQYGDEYIDVSSLEQIVDESQVRAIAVMIRYAQLHYVDGSMSLAKVVQRVVRDSLEHGFESISPYEGCSGFYALPRALEVGMVWNRVRGLVIR